MKEQIAHEIEDIISKSVFEHAFDYIDSAKVFYIRGTNTFINWQLSINRIFIHNNKQGEEHVSYLDIIIDDFSKLKILKDKINEFTKNT